MFTDSVSILDSIVINKSGSDHQKCRIVIIYNAYIRYRTIALAQDDELKLFDVTQATRTDTFLQSWKPSYIHGKGTFMICITIMLYDIIFRGQDLMLKSF